MLYRLTIPKVSIMYIIRGTLTAIAINMTIHHLHVICTLLSETNMLSLYTNSNKTSAYLLELPSVLNCLKPKKSALCPLFFTGSQTKAPNPIAILTIIIHFQDIVNLLLKRRMLYIRML